MNMMYNMCNYNELSEVKIMATDREIIKLGGPISYEGMTKEINITSQDTINFIGELWRPSKDGCWFFMKAMRNSRVKFETEFSGKVKPKHFMWQASNGMPPKNANIILQKCLEPACVNPEHLHNYTVEEVKELKEARRIRIKKARQSGQI